MEIFIFIHTWQLGSMRHTMFNYFHCDLLIKYILGITVYIYMPAKPCLLKYVQYSWWYLINTNLWYYIECSHVNSLEFAE